MRTLFQDFRPNNDFDYFCTEIEEIAPIIAFRERYFSFIASRANAINAQKIYLADFCAPDATSETRKFLLQDRGRTDNRH